MTRFDRAIPLLCVAMPMAILVIAYVWLAVDHGTVRLWHVTVHESGQYTLARTIFYPRHFLREVPIDVAMALFLLAGFRDVRRPPGPGGPPSRSAAGGWLLLAAATVMVVAAFSAATRELGARSAILDLLQYRTRDTVAAYGSHWHFHWLSTLWFGIAATMVAAVRNPEARAPSGRRGFLNAAWVWFGALTLVFGLSSMIFTDVRYTGHQAREIATHGPVTLMLGVGILLLLARGRETPDPDGGIRWSSILSVPARRPVRTGLLVVIPAYLAVVTFTGDPLAVGQSEQGLSAMVGAHFFEHTLDYLLVALLVSGGYLLRARARPATLRS